MISLKTLKKKKILLISYHYPPSVEVGGLRIGDFAKYLPKLGWETYVLTIADRYIKRVDKERFIDNEEVILFKTRLLPSIRQTYLELKRIYLRILKGKSISLNELEDQYNKPIIELIRKESIGQKIKRCITSCITRPDLETNWTLPAAFKAVREIRRHKIGCILTSCPPYSVHLVGLIAKWITGAKWIADFRDPWITAVPEGLYVTCSLMEKFERWLEKKVVENADLILTTTEIFRKKLKLVYQKQSEDKFIYIPNGYDGEIFCRFNGLRKFEKFTLTYIGSLYLGRTPEPIFRALRELISEGIVCPSKIRMNLIGNCQHINGYPTSQIVKNYGLDSIVNVLGQISYLKALRITKRSHLALLFAERQPFQIPAKVYDYIGLRTMILALTEDGATRDLLNSSTSAGATFYPSDIDGIKQFICNTMEKISSLGMVEYPSDFSEFDRKVIVRKLDNYLERFEIYT